MSTTLTGITSLTSRLSSGGLAQQLAQGALALLTRLLRTRCVYPLLKCAQSHSQHAFPKNTWHVSTTDAGSFSQVYINFEGTFLLLLTTWHCWNDVPIPEPQSSVQDFPVITPTSITQMYTPSSSSFEGSATATSEINSFPITYTESSYQSSSSQTTSPISSPSLSSALSFQGSSRATSASTTSSV